MNPLTDICLRYLDGDLSESEARDFDRLVAESPEAARELARHLIDEHYFTKIQVVEHHRNVDATHASDASAIQTAVRHLDRQEESEEVLRELLRMECEASPLPRLNEADPDGANKSKHIDARVQGKVADAAIYLLNQAARSPRVRWLAAAVVLLSAALVVAFMLHDPGDSGPAFTDRAEESTAQPATTPFIATLTAVDGAQWVSGDGLANPRLGDELAAGQRLTLQGGTAQITTERGAIANLQAPCHIELLEDGNGLRLMYGRLVGICETRASKGFLVRTPEVDVTDLGTRFGVDATRPNVTQVHVFEGEVKVAMPGRAVNGQEQVLLAGQAIAANRANAGFSSVDLDVKRFAAIQDAEGSASQALSKITGVRSMTGDLKIVSRDSFIGKEESEWPTDDLAVMFEEFAGRLEAEIAVNMDAPGVFNKIPRDHTATIPAGKTVRSYIILKTGNASDTETRVQGSVTFEHDVIGIITDQATSGIFAAATRADSPVFNPGNGGERWIELYAFREGVTLSEDRRTVTFQYQVKQSSDMIRVLVQEEQDESLP